jgi:glycosyltransferase involved in cell wall biosynthesis
MYQDKRIAVVVPCYNEERHVAEVIATMPDFVDHILIVDDRSKDATFEVATAAATSRTEVIRHEVNKGVGGSIVTGHRRAIELKADVVAVMAGDGQMDPAYLPSLLDPVVSGRKGFAKANRFYSANSFAGMPRYRFWGNVILTFLTKMASGYWNIVDPQNGYTAVSRSVLERMPLHKLAERYEFENDQLIWLNILDVAAVDVPIPAVYRDEVSTLRLYQVMPRLTRLLMGGFWRRMWRKYVLWSFSPIALLLLIGILMTVFGVAVGIWAIVQSIGPNEASTGTWLLAVGPTLVGIQMLTQALVLDIQATP